MTGTFLPIQDNTYIEKKIQKEKECVDLNHLWYE